LVAGQLVQLAFAVWAFTCDPDPFVVHFDVNKVEIDDHKVRAINKIREEHLVYEL